MSDTKLTVEPRRRDLVIDRSLLRARARADTRVQRFLDAARDLMNDGQGSEFTVQQVVERSGQSLQTFYRLFAGKHELTLALFQESMRMDAEHLREVISAEDDPTERLHRAVVECYRLWEPGRTRRKHTIDPAVMAELAQRLLTARPREASPAFAPLLALFSELVGAAEAAGGLRSPLPRAHVTSVILEMIVFNAYATTIGGSAARVGADGGAELLWDLLSGGIGAGP